MAATGASPGPQSTAVGVDHDRDAGAGGLARGRDRFGGALVQLDVLVAAFERARGVALHVFDVAGILQQRGVGLDALSLSAAEQFRHRDALELAADVPKRDVEPGERMHHRPGATEAVQQAFDARHKIAVGRVLADGEAADPSIERSADQRAAAAEGLAPADNAAAGRHPHIDRLDVGARLAGEQRRWRPGVERDAELDGVDGGDGDGHFAPQMVQASAAAIVADMEASAIRFSRSALARGRLSGACHTGSVSGGFAGGLSHPLFGPDHVAAMVAVGLWGAYLGPPAIYILPIVFPLVMAFGGVLGILACRVRRRDRHRGFRRRARHDGGAGGAAALVGRGRYRRRFRDLPRPGAWRRDPPGADALAYSTGFVVATAVCISAASPSACWRAGLQDGSRYEPREA